jgi:putative phosphoesterase
VSRVAILSDTHLPAATLPDWVADALEPADHTIHLGDFLTARAHFELRVLAGGEMTAVRGNRDPRLSLASVETVDVGGVRFVCTHGHDLGRGEAYERALVDLAADHDAAVAVAGHTHRVLDTVRDGVRLLNPGSATGAPPAEAASILVADCESGALTVECRRG